MPSRAPPGCYTDRVPRVAPFRGLVYDPAVAGPLDRLTAPPYDVISDDRRRRCLDGSPYNVVHLDLAEGDDVAGSGENRYTQAGSRLRAWRTAGVLVLSAEPVFFAYELRFVLDGEDRRLRGLICAMELEPWGGGVVPHEETMPGPIEDRLRLLRATTTHLSPIYGTVAGPNGSISELLDRVTSGAPLLHTIDEEGVHHRMWSIGGDTPVGRWLADERLLIADGHHRYATALEYRNERHASDGPGPWDRILTFVVDAGTEDVPVLPYHRVQLDGPLPTGGSARPDLRTLLRSLDDEALTFGTAVLDGDGVDYRVHRVGGEPPTVQALHRDLLDRVAAGDALTFTHEAEDAVRAVRDRTAVAAYLLPSTTPGRIRSVIERGERLPRKSTFFWPKPRTGMVLMPLDP
jgi:uncharacterized protein (DUF1015 family)